MKRDAFVKYHKERASYGGASREFHELAVGFLLDRDDRIAELRAALEDLVAAAGADGWDVEQEGSANALMANARDALRRSKP